MTTLPQSNNLAYLGVEAPNPPNVTVSNRDPLATDVQIYKLGDLWVNTTTSTVWALAAITAGAAVWTPTVAAAGAVLTLTGDAGGAIAPVAGDIVLAGGANITTTGAGNTITFDLDAVLTDITSVAATAAADLDVIMGDNAGANKVSFQDDGLAEVASIDSLGALSTAAGITAGTTLTATLGDITATDGDLVLATAGNKLSIATGANASAGTATLVNGTVTVATTAVTANSIVLLTRQTVGTTGANDLGILSVGTVTAGVSFVINAWTVTDATTLQADDQSVIGWLIIN